MTLRQYLIFMAIGTALAWTAVGLVVSAVDPTSAVPLVFVIFYAALFLALTGTIAIAAFGLRIALLKEQLVVSRHVGISFRQAFLFAFILCFALFLQGKHILNWWNGTLMVIAITFLESFFISAAANRRE